MQEFWNYIDNPQHAAEMAVYIGFSLVFSMSLFGFFWTTKLSNKK